ncbi:tRNA (N6-threonylcarbamoyladenosine(37)-N6)-methyltransferase TrmO [Dongshaea marina]|uniref:tRNA (N6-threonylcarbamoyladenosine(37)-N6)-methyltransferase TrmO n=1 Tax=Dongshaea marina TaxID=2047966 RepID=UPI000D3EDB15|nr:tRNA (N6-threonylcarbamoyladenosine(37)-N6)-methyltransferase TrmO [Dongshaea marina]
MNHNIEAIGTVYSPYRDKFAVPRQPGLVPSAKGYIELKAPYDEAEVVRGLEEFSHIWVLFLFHQNMDKGWTPTVRPPRLGGNRRVGVFASRSTFRPNGIGMSVLKLSHVEQQSGAIRLWVEGLDLVDGTPVVDIKPYLPYVDQQPDALGGFAPDAPQTQMQVEFNDEAKQACKQHSRKHPELKMLITELLEQDPRPAYRKKDESLQSYGMSLYHLNIRWEVEGDKTRVIEIVPSGELISQ